MKKGVTTVAFEDKESKIWQLLCGRVMLSTVIIASLMLTYLEEQQKIEWLESFIWQFRLLNLQLESSKFEW